jgi:prephenate dehydrogenase
MPKKEQIFRPQDDAETRFAKIQEELLTNLAWHREDTETLETFRRRLHAMERLVAATQRQLAAQGKVGA